MTMTEIELRTRAFERVAHVLHSFWEEQRYSQPRSAAVHSRLFDTLVYDKFIELNKKGPGRSYREHVVPCAYIRDLAFEMYWEGQTPADVALMIGRLLRIAYISTEERKLVDKKFKTQMPDNWDPKVGSILARLESVEITLKYEK